MYQKKEREELKMRVTKTIKEFIETEVTKVYEPKVNNVGKEYYDRIAKCDEELEALVARTNEEALAIAKKYDLGFYDYSGDAVDFIYSCKDAKNTAESNAIAEEKRELREEKVAKINNIIIDLELGAMNKQELLEAIAKLGE